MTTARLYSGRVTTNFDRNQAQPPHRQPPSRKDLRLPQVTAAPSFFSHPALG